MAITLLLLLSAVPLDQITSHADAVLAAQLHDGAIVHARAGDEIAIVPYFGNQAALGLFEAYRVTGDDRYLNGGIAWTDWYLEHMDAEGRVPEYRGTETAYFALDGEPTSIPASATFLRCANARRILTHDRYFLLREQSKLWKTYEQVMKAEEPDGLAPADPQAEYKITFYNAEVYEGLWHARQIARSLRDYSWNTRIYYARRKLDRAFDELRSEDGLYAWGKTRDGNLVAAAGAGAFNTVGLANLGAVTMGPLDSQEAKETLQTLKALYPDLESCSPGQLFLWYMAAEQTGDRPLAVRALRSLTSSVGPSGTAAEHGYCVRALARAETGEPRTFGVPMGSTYISFQRSAIR